MKIRVTQHHIDCGVRNSTWQCPIALALSDLTGTRDVSVGPSLLGYLDNGRPRRHFKWYRMPDEGAEFIALFDRGEPVQPFELEVSPQ